MTIDELGEELAPIFRAKLKEARKNLKDRQYELNMACKDLAESSTIDRWAYSWCVKRARTRVHKAESEVKRWKFYLNKAIGKITQHNIPIGEMKKVPISTFWPEAKHARYGRSAHRCPLPDHTDKSPSFTVYHNNNSWYCFGCHQGGDNIDLYMRLNNCDFKQAIKELSNY